MAAARARRDAPGMKRIASRCSRIASLAMGLGLAAWLASCAAPSRGLRMDDPPRAPVPEDIDREELTFAGTGELPLYAQRWRPRAGEIRGVLVIHHGLADHSARYAGFAERLVRAGYAVWALDMRGRAIGGPARPVR